MRQKLFLAAIASALTLGACGKAPKDNLGTADNAIVADGAGTSDPALRTALRDQIVVDPMLLQQSGDGALRPAPHPATGAVPEDAVGAAPGPAERERLKPTPPPAGICPQCLAARQALTLGALAEAQGGRTGQCAATITYSAAWATRLPAAVPLYPDARVSEAAGADGNGCALRVVSFASAAPLQRVLDWYYTRTTAAGFPTQHHLDRGEHVLAGTTAGAAMFATYRARRDGGTDVDLMVDAGR